MSNKDGVDIQNLGLDELQALVRSFVRVNIHVERENLSAFRGWAQPLSVCGLPAIDFRGTSISWMERTEQHVRLDGLDDYSVVLVLEGGGAVSQEGRVTDLTSGDLTLIEWTRPIDYLPKGYLRTLTFRLPRRMVVSNLGYEPGGAVSSRGTLAGRLIFQMAAEVLRGEVPGGEPLGGETPGSTQNDVYMQLAICDLLCALFARQDDGPRSGSEHTAKLFARVRSIIRDGFIDPDLTPAQVAAAAGISLRYLQKLFTPQGTTCSHFIHAMRLDHAARLLDRRTLQNKKLPLGEIALASGFRDYRFFSRKFRQRFGYGPGAYDQGN